MTQTLLEKIKGLQYFRGLQDLRDILVNFLSTVTALQTNSVIVGYSTRENVDVTSGTLVIGKEYIVGQQEPGDDFSNVGYVTDGVPFIATGTTPTTWTNNSTVSYYTGDINIIYNDLDPSLTISTGEVNSQFGKTSFIISNNKFLQAKTYPVFETALATVVDDNTIEFDKVGGYFKIEVYN